MYNMRYHLASLVSVFFALAIGLVLGGLISERAPDNIHEVLLEGIERDIAQVREDNTRLRAQNTLAYEFANLLMGNFAEGKLDERSILVLGDDDLETRIVMDILEGAGALVVHAVPEFSDDYNEWRLQSDQDLTEENLAMFTGIVNVFEPASEEGEYLSDYFVYLREMKDYYAVPVIFVSAAGVNEADDANDEEISDLIAYAWEEGFSGTNQLGNRYGAYTLLVLLASDTEGKYGSGENALALYPPLPDEWLVFVDLDDEEEAELEDTPENEENAE